MSSNKQQPRVLITTTGFGQVTSEPTKIMEDAGITVVDHKIGRTLTEDEVIELAGGGFQAIIAGSDPITARVMDAVPGLRLIARTGIGFNAIDILAARERGITVTYTPDGPTEPVAEIAVGMMIDLLRRVSWSDRVIRGGGWDRFTGRRVATCTVGLIGVGRIGKAVTRILTRGFPGVRVLANDLEPNEAFGREFGLEWADKDTLFSTCDLVSLHIPFTRVTSNMVAARELSLMKPGSCLVNTARGGIVNEADLAQALRDGHLAGAAMDVFKDEPYGGELAGLEHCLMNSHAAGSTEDSRIHMESGAAREVCNLILGRPFESPVPDIEYERAAE